MNDYYDILGVPKNASPDEIKRAYRKAAHQHHPDKGGESQRFKEINEAYQALSDPEKRARYDQFGQAGVDGFSAQGGPAAGWDFDFGGFSARGGSAWGGGFGGGGLNDLFEGIFGAAMATVQTELRIHPAQAALGGEVSFKLNGELHRLRVPAGTQDGTQFRFKGKGMALRRGGRGDLIVVVRIEVPKRMSRAERELWERLLHLQK